MDEQLEENSTEENNSKQFRLPLLFLLFAIIGIGVITFSTSPGQGGPVIILIFLFLTFIFALTAALILIQVLNNQLFRKPFSWLRLLYTSIAVAVGFVFLVGLQTLKQLQVVDILLVVLFETLLNFYLLRRF